MLGSSRSPRFGQHKKDNAAQGSQSQLVRGNGLSKNSVSRTHCVYDSVAYASRVEVGLSIVEIVAAHWKFLIGRNRLLCACTNDICTT
jgi:hypothetical protein